MTCKVELMLEDVVCVLKLVNKYELEWEEEILNARTFDLGYGYHFTVTTTDSFQTFVSYL